MLKSSRLNISDKVSFTKFLNWIDDNGGEYMIKKLSDWYQEAMEYQLQFIKDLEEKDQKENKKRAKKLKNV